MAVIHLRGIGYSRQPPKSPRADGLPALVFDNLSTRLLSDASVGLPANPEEIYHHPDSEKLRDAELSRS